MSTGSVRALDNIAIYFSFFADVVSNWLLCKNCSAIIYFYIVTLTRCSMRETRETALLHVACGNPARRRYCMGEKFSCISSLHAYSYIHQSGCNLQTMNAKNTKKSLLHENAYSNITCDFGDGDISRSRS